LRVGVSAGELANIEVLLLYRALAWPSHTQHEPHSQASQTARRGIALVFNRMKRGVLVANLHTVMRLKKASMRYARASGRGACVCVTVDW
jgi:hypothetical protein